MGPNKHVKFGGSLLIDAGTSHLERKKRKMDFLKIETALKTEKGYNKIGIINMLKISQYLFSFLILQSLELNGI